MVNGFIQSPEGEAEFSKLGLEYPREIFDRLYEEYIRNTRTEDLEKYTHHREKEIVDIKRVKTGDKEFITYSTSEYRLDEALNIKHFFRSDVGKFPIPKAIYTVKQVAFGKQQREVSDIANIETGYSIPFTKEKMNELRQIGLSQSAHFSVEHSNGIRISVETFEDLRDGQYNELSHFGTIPNDVQRQRWIAENGMQKDQDRLAEVLRQKIEGEIPQKSVTAEQVKNMIASALDGNNSGNGNSSSTKKKQKPLGQKKSTPTTPKKE